MGQRSQPDMNWPLTNVEKEFLRKGWAKNAPAQFLVHHVWICRIVGIEPEWDELEGLTALAQQFIIDDK